MELREGKGWDGRECSVRVEPREGAQCVSGTRGREGKGWDCSVREWAENERGSAV